MICDCLTPEDDHYQTMQKLRPDLITLSKTNKLEDLKEIISKINKELVEIDYEYHAFSSPSEALDYIKTNEEINGEIYNSIFASYK